MPREVDNERPAMQELRRIADEEAQPRSDELSWTWPVDAASALSRLVTLGFAVDTSTSDSSNQYSWNITWTLTTK